MKISISDYPTHNKEWDKKKIKSGLKETLKKIGELQNQMHAQNKQSLLIVLQGTDASGKDGLTKGLLKYCNPVGIHVHSFKKPTENEYAHDFLWRVHQVVPRKGDLQIFIRSHYEDILVPTVEKLFPEEVIEERYQLINDFEKLIRYNGTTILKFFMHVSRESQEERLMERIEMKEKHWKHKDGDWDTREKYDQYLKVYERIINTCNHVPWHIVPSDTNWQKLNYISGIVLKTLEEMDLHWPELVSQKFGQKK